MLQVLLLLQQGCGCVAVMHRYALMDVIICACSCVGPQKYGLAGAVQGSTFTRFTHAKWAGYVAIRTWL